MSVELRDRFFALAGTDPTAEEAIRFRAEVEATEAGAVTTLDGLDLSWHPTARHKAVRLVEAERIDERVRDLFARPAVDAPYLAAAFVDPQELSFRTFENIVPLDRLFEDVALDADLGAASVHADGVFTFTLSLPQGARERLARLDNLGLYVPPLNAVSRGGSRFIFHSALLGEALTAAVADALPPGTGAGFSHVNPVFRCNRFEPGDANFHRHRDTPYYDAGRNHVSRYTMLIYLTGGTGAPALNLGFGLTFDRIEEFTCVVFDQRLEHEGAPYRDGRKVFLRTELVFAAEGVLDAPEIGPQFSKACYLTGESVFAPELARHADAYYNQVNAAHWGEPGAAPARETFVHKEFRGVHFVTNGYDFWFPRSDALALTECAALTLLDYFNCRVGDTPFRAACNTEVVEAADAAWIPAFLRGRPARSPLTRVAKDVLFPEPEEPDDSCCPFHSGMQYDPTRHGGVIKEFLDAQSFAKAHILPAPILMLGEEVALDPEQFIVQDGRIHVLGRDTLTPVNFAACWNDGSSEEEYVRVAAKVGVAHFLVPPILYTTTADLHHLRFDFFRNSWMVEHRQGIVPVPRISEEQWVDPEGDKEGVWWRAVDRNLVDARTPLPFEDWDDEEDEDD